MPAGRRRVHRYVSLVTDATASIVQSRYAGSVQGKVLHVNITVCIECRLSKVLHVYITVCIECRLSKRYYMFNITLCIEGRLSVSNSQL